jgi:hypothetical protein
MPPEGKFTLLIGVILNVMVSFVFERYLQDVFGRMLELLSRLPRLLRGVQQSSQTAYKSIESGMTRTASV